MGADADGGVEREPAPMAPAEHLVHDVVLEPPVALEGTARSVVAEHSPADGLLERLDVGPAERGGLMEPDAMPPVPPARDRSPSSNTPSSTHRW